MRVYTGGTFDLFHWGHAEFLRRARALGDSLAVAVNLDEFVAEFKRKPVCDYYERSAVLWACKYVDQVIPNFGGADSREAIEYVNPQIIAIGDDWADRDYLGQLGITQGFLDARGITIKYLPYSGGISTTELIRRLLPGENDDCIHKPPPGCLCI